MSPLAVELASHVIDLYQITETSALLVMQQILEDYHYTSVIILL